MSSSVFYQFDRGVVKKKRWWSTLARPFISLMFVAVSALAGVTLTASAATSTPWEGNGTTNGFCSTVTNDVTVPAGQQRWLFILTSPDGSGPWTLTATFSPPTSPSPAVINGVQQGGGSIHFTVYTTLGAQLLSASATNGSGNSVLTVSHCERHQQLQISKTATTSFTRAWDWTIDKTCDQTQLTLAIDEQFGVNCSVSVNASSTDSAWGVAGNITIHNPDASASATVTGVTDVITGPIAVTPNCPVSFPYTLAAGGTLICTYTSPLPNANSRTNTATVTTSGAIAGNSAQAAVTFSSTPTTETDECVNVTDTVAGTLGTVCADETLPHVFNYSLTLAYATCGPRQFVNTARFRTNDTQTTNTDSWTVNVTVPCVGCTLTQGYWKTHATAGTRKFDDTWLLIGANGSSTTFFLSGKTWLQVFNTAPGGNAYYQLAHQYMAARLNVLNGASAPANVQAALNDATALFNTYTPAQITALKGNNALRNQFLTLAGILGSYNEGQIGPGHCSEQAPQLL